MRARRDRARTLFIVATGLAAAAVAASCHGPLVFVCTADPSCNRDGVLGQCTQAPSGTKYCALPDNAICSGGLKWDDTAGDGLSGSCVLGGGGGDMAGGGNGDMAGADLAVPPVINFRIINSGTQGDLYGLSGWAPTNELWVVGPAGVFYLKGDGSFTNVSPDPQDAGDGFSVDWYSVAAVGPSEAFVTCDSGDVFHTSDKGTTWSHTGAATADILSASWAFSATDVLAVGRNGALSHTMNGGTSWMYRQIDQSADINAIWGDTPTDLYAVGTGGVVYRSGNDGSTWGLQSIGSMADLFAVWGTSSSNVWVVGDSQVVFRYDGTGWTQVRSAQPMQNNMYPAFFSIWASGPNDVYAVGVDNTFAGVIYHATDGKTFTQTSYVGSQINAIWGFSPTLIYACGPGGLILKGSP